MAITTCESPLRTEESDTMDCALNTRAEVL